MTWAEAKAPRSASASPTPLCFLSRLIHACDLGHSFFLICISMLKKFIWLYQFLNWTISTSVYPYLWLLSVPGIGSRMSLKSRPTCLFPKPEGWVWSRPGTASHFLQVGAHASSFSPGAGCSVLGPWPYTFKGSLLYIFIPSGTGDTATCGCWALYG